MASNLSATPDISKLVQQIKEYRLDNIQPNILQWDRDSYFPKEVFEFLHEQNLMSVCIPREHGGNYLPLPLTLELVRELAKGSTGIATGFFASQLGLTPIMEFGSAEVKQEAARRFLDSKSLIGLAMTEKDSGIDVANITTTAVNTGEGISLNGEKNYITNAGVSSSYSIFAKHTDSNGSPLGISAFYVPSDLPGFEINEYYDKIGNRDSKTGVLKFNNVLLKDDYLLGEPGRGLDILSVALSRSKTMIGAVAVGVAQHALEIAQDSLFNRVRKKGPLLFRADVQNLLCTLHAKVNAAWQLTKWSATEWEANGNAIIPASQVKLFCSDLAVSVVNECVELVGAKAYMNDHELSKLIRDVKLLEIYEGSTSVQTSIMARSIFQDYYSEYFRAQNKAA